MSHWSKQTWSDLLVSLNDHGILSITLNRAEASNAFSDEMIHSLVTVLDHAEHDTKVRVIIFSGAGKNFCAGGDVKAMHEESGMFAGASDELRRRYQAGIQRIPIAMERLSKPTIAVVHGAAVGAGCDFACMSDMRVGGPKTFFAETFAKLGLVPGDGGTFFLPRVIGWSRAMEMFMTGRKVAATQALNWNLLNYMTEEGQELKKAMELAHECLEMAPIAQQLTKKAMRLSWKGELQQALDMLAAFQGISQRTADHKDAVSALLEKRSPTFKGQ